MPHARDPDDEPHAVEARFYRELADVLGEYAERFRPIDPLMAHRCRELSHRFRAGAMRGHQQARPARPSAHGDGPQLRLVK